MNKEEILSHLKDASEELGDTIKEIENDSDFSFCSYFVNIQHAYHHINTAWNIREENPKKVEACSEEDFHRWRKFPDDIDLK